MNGEHIISWNGCKIDNKIGLAEQGVHTDEFVFNHIMLDTWGQVYFYIKVPDRLRPDATGGTGGPASSPTILRDLRRICQWRSWHTPNKSGRNGSCCRSTDSEEAGTAGSRLRALPASASFPQKPFQFTTGRGNIRPSCGLADSHDDIDWTKLITQLTEYFANGALHQRTCNRTWSALPADYDSQAGLFARRAGSAQNDKKLPLAPRRKRTGKLRFAAQPRFARQPGARCLQTAKRARPLARRALITARPPRVFMRSRKPCVRARRVLEGW